MEVRFRNTAAPASSDRWPEAYPLMTRYPVGQAAEEAAIAPATSSSSSSGLHVTQIVITGVLSVLVVVVLIIVATLDTSCSQQTTTNNYYELPSNGTLNVTCTNITDCDWCTELYNKLINITICEGPPPARSVRSGGETLYTRAPPPGCMPLVQEDFDEGTFIMDTPDTCYYLAEDIVFEPNAAYDHRPLPNQTQYQTPGFVLGFFAAVSIQADAVVFDLDGHTLSQSRVHALQQRFFALIELADRPFVAGQGPVNFGTDATKVASRVYIRNGVLGFNSHHGIHGNFPTNVLIEDLDIVNYEVAAVAINGGTNVMLNRVRALGTITSVPVLGTYSQSRFLLQFATKALAQFNGTDAVAEARLSGAKDVLELLVAQTLGDVNASGAINATAHPEAWALFGNTNGRTDGGTNYGFLFVDRSPAVNGFSCDRSSLTNAGMHRILIQNSEVHDVVGEPREVVALHDGTALARGPAGDVLRFEDAMVLSNGSYLGTPLFDAQVALAALVKNQTSGYGTLNVHSAVLEWALNGTSFTEYVSNGTFSWIRNGDAMHHVPKGPIGLRLDGGSDIMVRDTSVIGVRNHGAAAKLYPFPGESNETAYYSHSGDGGHEGQDPQGGYMGADVRGVSIAAVQGAELLRCEVRNVQTEFGWAHGIDVFNDAASVTLEQVRVFGVSSLASEALTPMGPKIGHAVGLRSLSNAEAPTLKDVTVEDISTGYLGLAYRTLYEETEIEACSADTTNFYAS